MAYDPGDQPTQPMEVPPANGRNRRDFLKAAVIGSAAVAAAGGVATAGLALTGKKPAIIPFIGGVNSGGQGECHVCVTSSEADEADAQDFDINFNGDASAPGEFYVFFWDTA